MLFLNFIGMIYFNDVYSFYHESEDFDCGLNIIYHIYKVNGNINQLSMKLSTGNGIYHWGTDQSIEDGDCPEPQTYVDSYLLPLQTVTLTKVP